MGGMFPAFYNKAEAAREDLNPGVRGRTPNYRTAEFGVRLRPGLLLKAVEMQLKAGTTCKVKRR